MWSGDETADTGLVRRQVKLNIYSQLRYWLHDVNDCHGLLRVDEIVVVKDKKNGEERRRCASSSPSLVKVQCRFSC